MPWLALARPACVQNFRAATSPALSTLVLLLGVSAGPGAARAAAPAHAVTLPAPGELARAVDAYAAPFTAAEQLSGQLLVAYGDEIVLERAYGWANRELESPVTPQTCFNIASISKPLTAAIALQLIAEQKLAVADTVGKWIPGFVAGDRMTIGHLLGHQAGIPHRFTNDAQEAEPHTAAEMVELARHVTLDFPPGERTQYSSGNYVVLARILELASGRSYAELLQERVAAPLGLRHTAHADSRKLLPGRAASYVPGVGGMENAPLKDYSFLVGAGSVGSNARDLHRLLRAVALGTLGESVRASLLRGGKLRWNGFTNGFRALAEYDSATAVSVVFVGNYHTGAVDRLAGAVRSVLAGRTPLSPAVPRWAAAAVPAEVLQRCEGLYDVAGNPRLQLRVRDGAVFMNDWVMIPTSETTFFSPRDYAVVTVVTGVDGHVERLDWTIGDQTYPCPRVGNLPAAEAAAP